MISILIREFYSILLNIILINFILSSDDVITDNEELRPKLIQLNERIVNMCYHIYRRRPTCAELLSDYNQWGIDDRQLKHSNDFEENDDENDDV